jgi:tetratricopeptide (TPR) repeat protein
MTKALLKKNITILLLFAILLLTAILYIPVFKNQLTNWDDDLYILNNPYLRSLSFENIFQILGAFFAGNYHPLTLLSLAIDYKIGGSQLWAFHLTNLILHLCNTLLVFIFIKQLIRQNPVYKQRYILVPYITALLFGIHSLQVESVAWIAERKNVLYAFFFLASLILYLRYIHRKSMLAYGLSILLFVLSLLSKGMAAPLSISIICIDYFTGRKLLSKKVIIEKIPFLLLSLLFGYLAIKAQISSESLITDSDFSWFERILIASYGCIQYLTKLVYPYNLSAFYPYPVKPGMSLPYSFYLSFVGVWVIIYVLWRFFRNNKAVIWGALFFTANIAMVIQLVPVGNAIIADRYVYIPSIGIFLIVGYTIAVLCNKNKITRTILLPLLLVYSIIIGYNTFYRVKVWENSLTLWNDAIQKYPVNNDKGYQNRAVVFYDKGMFDQALQDYNRALLIDPKNAGAYLGIGLIKQVKNDKDGAMKDFNTALSFGPLYEGYLNRAVLKMELSDYKGALEDLNKAYQLDPLRADAFINQGTIFYQTGNYALALDNYNQALQLSPQSCKTYLGRGMVKQAMNDTQGAMDDFNIAINIDPSYDGYYNRAVLKMGIGDYGGATDDLNKAIQINPSIAEAYINKGYVCYITANYTDALKNYNEALRLNSHDSRAFTGRGLTHRALNEVNRALCDFDSAVYYSHSYDAYINRAALQIALNEIKKAQDDLSQAFTIDSLRSETFYYRGLIKIKQGYKTGGYKDLKKSASMGNPWATAEIQKL